MALGVAKGDSPFNLTSVGCIMTKHLLFVFFTEILISGKSVQDAGLSYALNIYDCIINNYLETKI